MYNLPYHKENDEILIDELIAKYPFAFVTGCDAQNKPIATQIPLFIEMINGKKVMRGHIMKDTDHYRAFLNNPNVLAVFTGKHTYVSGTWYKNPNTPSTWNYMSVHLHGKLRFVGKDELQEILQSLSLHFEENNPESPTVYNNLPAGFKQGALELIAGFEFEITKVDTVFKLSQDRDEESYQNIIDKLNEQDEAGLEIANEMEKRKGKI